MSAFLAVKVKPNARKTEVIAYQDSVLMINISEPPIKGQANQALIEYLAEIINKPKNNVIILMGFGSRNKLVEVVGMIPQELDSLLKSLFPKKKGIK